jgi:hypothetical protein
VSRAGPDPVAEALAYAESVREALLATSLSQRGFGGGGSGRPRNAPALAVDEAHRRVWREGLGDLARTLPRALSTDGVCSRRSAVALAALVGSLDAVRAHARELGVPVPLPVTTARAAALDALDALEAGLGSLPPAFRDGAGAMPAGAAEALAAARSTWSALPGAPAPTPLVARAGRARAVVTDAWALRAFGAGGLVVGTHPLGSATGRLVAWGGSGDGASGLVLGWDLDGTGLLASGEEPELAASGPVSLLTARVDGRRARIDAAWASGVRRWHRTVRTQQARVRVEDTLHRGGGTVRRAWVLGPGWALRRDAAAWIARRGGLSLHIVLPEGWDWRVTDGPAGVGLVGHGRVEAGACAVASFELRRASGGGVAEGDDPLRPQ